MNFLSVEKISKSFGLKTLFKDLSFGIEQGQKIALVAKNGAGKSTLLKILLAKDQADEGRITFRENLTIGVLEQEPIFDEESTVFESLFHGDQPLLKAVREYEVLLEENEDTEDHQTRLQAAMDRMDHLHAWDYEYKVKEILANLKIDKLQMKVSSLSGGQRKRLALARVLVEPSDLLILDEPTNHLDIEMIEWLEEFLRKPDVTLLLVTHDRYFLENICDEILELEDKTLYRHTGNYSYYVEKKAEREFIEARELSHTRNLYRKELNWIRKQPKARTTKSKSRVDAFYDLQEKATGKASDQDLKLNIKMSRMGSKILELKNITKSYGDKVILKNFKYLFKRGERVGLVGANGVGKSTFLNIITGEEQADIGSIDPGETIQFGYFSQKGLLFDENQKVIEIVRDVAEAIPMADGSVLSASQLLSLFLFPPEVQHTPVFKLSGGEKRRLYLLTVLMKNPNFLILDEPTNDLDLATLSILEEFLVNFPGCLIIVSHDRYFMDKLDEHLLVFEGDGRLRWFDGNFEEYHAKHLEETGGREENRRSKYKKLTLR